MGMVGPNDVKVFDWSDAGGKLRAGKAEERPVVALRIVKAQYLAGVLQLGERALDLRLATVEIFGDLDGGQRAGKYLAENIGSKVAHSGLREGKRATGRSHRDRPEAISLTLSKLNQSRNFLLFWPSSQSPFYG